MLNSLRFDVTYHYLFALIQKLHANEKQIANLSLELSTAENKVRSLARERDILESTVKQLNEKLLVDENVINSVNTNALTVSENQKVELDRAYEKIYALENEVKGLQSEISRQDANLMLQGESNKRVVDTLEARVMELNQELHVFKEKEKIMRVAETDVDKDNGNADALVKRLQCLMEDMSAKQTQQFQLLFETTKASRANISEDAKTENNKKCVGVKDKKSLEQEMKHADVESLVTPGSHLNLPAEGGDIEIMASSPDSMLEGEVSSTDVSYSESNSDSVSSTPASALEAEVLSTPRPGKSGAFSRLARGLQTPITPLCVEGAGFATPSLADMAKMEYHQLLSLIADYKADVHQRKVQLRKKKGMLLVKQKKLEKQRKSWKASKAALGQLQMKYDAIHKQLKRKQKAGHGRGQVKLDVELLSEMQSDMAKKQKRLQQSSTLLNAEAQVLNQEVGGLRDSNASIVEQEHKIEKFERLAAKLRQQKRDSKLQPGSNFNNQKRVPMDDSLLDDHKALHSLLDGLNAFASPGVRGAASDSDSTNITDMFFQFDAVGGGKKKDRDSASNPSPTPHPPPTPPPQMAYPHHLFHPAAHYYYPGVPHPGPMGLPAGYYGRQDQVPVPLQYYPPPYWNPAAQPQPEGNFKLQSSVDHSTQNRAPSGPALSTLYDQYKSNDMHAQAIHNKQGTVQLQQYLKQRNASSSLCDNHTR